MAYFSASAFSGLDDSPAGFYTVYRNLFEELARQEEAYADADGGFSGPIPSTTFGSSKADSRVVKEFYNFWLSFSTRMSFAWSDDHKTRMVNIMIRFVLLCVGFE